MVVIRFHTNSDDCLEYSRQSDQGELLGSLLPSQQLALNQHEVDRFVTSCLHLRWGFEKYLIVRS